MALEFWTLIVDFEGLAVLNESLLWTLGMSNLGTF